jgi:hypothetical protein
MLNLRQKARSSLTQLNTPPGRQKSEPSTPTVDGNVDDELSVLGGRSRLIASKEKSTSPAIGELSPNSMNPIVPFPVLHDLDAQAHPVVLEYLRTFQAHNHPGPSQQSQMQPQQPVHGSFDRPANFSELTPISSGFMSTNTSPYSGPPMQQSMLASSPLEMNPQSLPQYFPVFDYSGYVGPENTFSHAQLSPELELSGRSYSPDANNSMQTAWQDFVAQIGHI